MADETGNKETGADEKAAEAAPEAAAETVTETTTETATETATETVTEAAPESVTDTATETPSRPMPPVRVKPSSTASSVSPFSIVTVLSRSSSSVRNWPSMVVSSGPSQLRTSMALPRKSMFSS